MPIFDDESRPIYRKAARRRLASVTRDAERSEDLLPEWERSCSWQLECRARPTVHGAVLRYAAELGGARLWLMTFAANVATIQLFASHDDLRPQVLVFSRNCLSTSPAMLDAARAWCQTVECRRVHAKVAVLVGELGSMVISGSANLSKNAGIERMDLSSYPSDATRWREVIERIAREAEGKKR